MASSGSFNTNGYEGRYLKFSWNIKSQDIANNKTTISWSLKGAGSGSASWYKAGNFKVVINGSTVYSSSTRIQLYNGTTVASGEAVIPHNSDGTKTFSASAEAGIYTVAVNCRGSGSWSLNAIPRQATITSATNFNDTQNPTITYSNPAGNNVSSLKACISLTGNTDDISYRDIPKTGTSYTFNLTESERNILRQASANSKNLSVRFYVQTVINGATYRNYVSATMTVVNANPSIGTIAYKDNNSSTVNITQDNQQIIRNKSDLYFTFNNLQSLKYATLSSVKVTINGVTKTSSLSGSSVSSKNLDFGIINVSSNIDANIVITDSRGNTTSYTKTIQVLDYQSQYSTITCERENNFYTETNLLVNCTYSSLDGKNNITIQYQTKKVTDADYGALTTIDNNTNYVIQLDNAYQWNVRVVTTDSVGTIVSYVLFVDKGMPLAFFDRLLNSVGINCFPSKQYSLALNDIDILEAIQGVSLYSNTSGDEGTIQLSDSAANYDKLYIEFIDNDGTVGSKEITSPNGKNVYLSITYPSSVSYKKDVIVSISGKAITPTTYSTITFRNNQSPTINSSTNYIYITKVIGFKYS